MIHGNVTLDELMSRLLSSFETYQSQLIVEIREDEERIARDAVKREQDLAFEMSLVVRLLLLSWLSPSKRTGSNSDQKRVISTQCKLWTNLMFIHYNHSSPALLTDFPDNITARLDIRPKCPVFNSQPFERISRHSKTVHFGRIKS